MKKSILLLTALALPLLAGVAPAQATQTETPRVTISAKGDDVRSLLHEMFKQAGKNFVLAPGVRFVLYLSLDKIEFDEALTIVCQQASLQYEVDNGIYYISLKPKKIVAPVEPIIEEKKVDAVKSQPKVEKPVVVVNEPKGTLPQSVLGKRFTTRFQKTDIRTVFAAMGKQTDVTIEVDPSVPAFKLDAFLLNTSLKYGLDQITSATKLTYRFTDNMTIRIERKVVAAKK